MRIIGLVLNVVLLAGASGQTQAQPQSGSSAPGPFTPCSEMASASGDTSQELMAWDVFDAYSMLTGTNSLERIDRFVVGSALNARAVYLLTLHTAGLVTPGEATIVVRIGSREIEAHPGTPHRISVFLTEEQFESV